MNFFSRDAGAIPDAHRRGGGWTGGAGGWQDTVCHCGVPQIHEQQDQDH